MKRADSGKEQELLRHARREGLLIMIVWAIALLWSVVSANLWGYRENRDPATIELILGMPDWVFWSVALPWGLCVAFTSWFCFGFMADDDLGQDPDEEAAGHA
jgi:uncharacterized protein involved in cysteine biosynthesis